MTTQGSDRAEGARPPSSSSRPKKTGERRTADEADLGDYEVQQ